MTETQEATGKAIAALAEIMPEVMNKYNELRSNWIKKFGSEEGFRDWFTERFFKSIS